MNRIPDPVWYIGAAALAAFLLYRMAKGTTEKAAKAALAVGDAVQDSVVPGDGTLGTWLYDFLHGAPTFKPTEAQPKPKPLASTSSSSTSSIQLQAWLAGGNILQLG